MNQFKTISEEIRTLIEQWEPILSRLSHRTFTERINKQQRNIKQIVGHMVDSASNNTHRIIHLQYGESPVTFPDYANLGNNDKWIAIQNYKDEEWAMLLQFWKYIHLHICHVINQVDETKLNNVWISALDDKIILQEMITDFPRHLKLHLSEIDELMNSEG